ncbi:hypothetical protein [Streptomyces sp. F001]|uniref:hypothetical protein n=1 Tax=Streptomyces sp. F001 TaxID=1510026 RepID=UPI0013EE7D84|nr:hypothetical protein [Streptomyces sp. F001]
MSCGTAAREGRLPEVADWEKVSRLAVKVQATIYSNEPDIADGPDVDNTGDEEDAA